MSYPFRNRLRAGAAFVAIFAATPAFAEEAAADAADSAGVEEIVVLGQGQARQVQELGAADIALEVSGISPLKAIDKLPGVNFQAADPFGAYELVGAHLDPRFQPESARFHARRRSARRHELWQP